MSRGEFYDTAFRKSTKKAVRPDRFSHCGIFSDYSPAIPFRRRSISLIAASTSESSTVPVATAPEFEGSFPEVPEGVVPGRGIFASSESSGFGFFHAGFIGSDEGISGF